MAFHLFLAAISDAKEAWPRTAGLALERVDADDVQLRNVLFLWFASFRSSRSGSPAKIAPDRPMD